MSQGNSDAGITQIIKTKTKTTKPDRNKPQKTVKRVNLHEPKKIKDAVD